MTFNKNFLLVPSMAAIALTLAACASNPNNVNVKLQYVPDNASSFNTADTNAQSELAQSASSVSQSLEELSAIQQATHSNTKIAPPVDPAVIGMAQLSSINWNGPIEPLLQQIAKNSGYKLQVLGAEPAIPVIVSLNVKNTPLATILRNAMFQAQHKADVTVYPSSKVIELRYYSV